MILTIHNSHSPATEAVPVESVALTLNESVRAFMTTSRRSHLWGKETAHTLPTPRGGG